MEAAVRRGPRRAAAASLAAGAVGALAAAGVAQGAPVPDFGDAPDGRPTGYGPQGRFPSVLASDGARAERLNVRLGDRVDREPDAHQVRGDRGDDGVAGQFRACRESFIQVTVRVGRLPARGTAYLNLFADFDRDGRWRGSSACGQDGAPEWAVRNFRIDLARQRRRVQTYTIPFTAGRFASPRFWRRVTLSVDQPLGGPRGLIRRGEVEDYLHLPSAPGWRTLPGAPQARTEVVGVAFRGRLAAIGGFTRDGGSSARVDVYNPRTRRWSRLPDLPQGVNHAMAAAAAGVLYVVGGNDGSVASSRAFALRGGAWQELPPMPQGRSAGGAAIVDGRLYVVGGVGPAGLVGSGFAFDLAAGTWASLPGLQVSREHLGVTALGGIVYALGGRTAGLDSNLRTAEAFDPAAGRWRRLPPMPTARGGTSAGAVSGLVVSVGGEGPEGTFSEVEAFDPTSNVWQSLPPSPRPRHGVGVVGFRGMLYQLLGGPQPGFTFSGTALALRVDRRTGGTR